MIERFLPGLGHLHNLHPAVVHFPIALLLGSFLFYVMSLIFRREGLAKSGFAMLALGAVSSLAAASTGLSAEDGVTLPDAARAALLEPHEQWMLAASALSVVLAGWAFWRRPMPQKGKWIFLGFLAFLAGVLVMGGDLGGRMVYEYNAGGTACQTPKGGS